MKKKTFGRSGLLRAAALVLCMVLVLFTLTAAMADGGTLLARSKKKKATATPAVTVTPAPIVTEAPADPALAAAQEIVDYLDQYGRLPDNFLTKKQAQALGWDSTRNYVSDVAPGKALGGSHFGNYEGQLPDAWGRSWSECDCYYRGGKRNAYRLLYSNDGLYYYSADHYNTFTELRPSWECQ